LLITYRYFFSGHPEFTAQPDDISQAATVAEVVQHFITAMDALELKSREIDEVQPLVSDVLHRYEVAPWLVGTAG
jgi:hypothetical protein